MKTNMILRRVGSLVLILSLFIISSCTKSNENATEVQKDENYESTSIDKMDITETDEDLSTIDYKEFYDQLSQHGEWIQVNSEETGLKPNTSHLQNNSSDDNKLSLSDIFGIQDAKASSDITDNMVFVWKPSADLGVSVKSGETPEFIPYTNGQWINTDAGWYFKAPTPEEETVSHYGRWVNSPTAGWMWVPGRVWSPAWVDWKQEENYVSWAPLPPSSYLIDNVINEPVIDSKDYVIVEKKYFLEPKVYKYCTLYYKDGNTIPVKDMSGTEGIVVINNAINNVGPDVNVIRNIYGRNIDYVKLHHVQKHKEVIYSDGEYYVYSPGFRKYKNKGNKRAKDNMPQSYMQYDDWNIKNSNEKGFNNDGNNPGNNNNSNMKNGNNDKKNNGNNGKMNNGNNDKKNNGNNGKKNNGNNGNMNNGNMNNGNNDKNNNGNNGMMNNGNNGKNKGNKNKGKK